MKLKNFFHQPIMTQNKAKPQKPLTQKHIYSRISYLYQAANYLAKVADQSQARKLDLNDQVKLPSEFDGEVQSAVTAPGVGSEKCLPISPTEQRYRASVIKPRDEKICKYSALSRQLVVHLRAVSLKSQIRLSPAMKHTMCKRCGIILVPGSTSTFHMENNSRGARKPWAEVSVMTCAACGTAKRFPVGVKRQLRRESRIGRAQKT